MTYSWRFHNLGQGLVKILKISRSEKGKFQVPPSLHKNLTKIYKQLVTSFHQDFRVGRYQLAVSHKNQPKRKCIVLIFFTSKHSFSHKKCQWLCKAIRYPKSMTYAKKVPCNLYIILSAKSLVYYWYECMLIWSCWKVWQSFIRDIKYMAMVYPPHYSINATILYSTCNNYHKYIRVLLTSRAPIT